MEDKNLFNRGQLLNIGFVEAMKDFHWDCIILHDVDLLPMNKVNFYTCKHDVCNAPKIPSTYLTTLMLIPSFTILPLQEAPRRLDPKCISAEFWL